MSATWIPTWLTAWTGRPTGGASFGRMALRALALVVVTLAARTGPAEARGFGITDAPTAQGIRLVHLPLAGETGQALAFFWRDRHALHSPETIGLLRLAPRLLVAGGAGPFDGGALEEEFKDLGASVALRRSTAFTLGELHGPAETIGQAARLLRLMMMEPRLPPRHLARIKREVISSARAQRETAEPLAADALVRLLAGDHPLVAASTMEPPSVVDAVSLADIEAWRKAVLARDNLVVVTAGPLDRAAVAALVDETFGGLPATAELRPALAFQPLRPLRTIAIERAVAQTVIVAGQATGWNATSEGPARDIAMTVLGRGGASRLWRAVRERLGASYGTEASIGPLTRGHYRLMMRSSVATGRTADALAAVRQEFERFLAEGVGPDEVEPVKTRIVTEFAEAMRRSNAAANRVRGMLLDGQGMDDLEAYADRVGRVSASDVNALIARHLSSRLVVIVVTPSAAGLGADCVVKSLAEVSSCPAAD
ncbi:M16 family metallopeptidase [Phreatobacter stygius]|uniref:Insulinase family protein n=1 Tax=Phreatobacter stygius TaxID=1940610 RepID=A0A4D7BAF8_9HYPH|nr:pitrilysin family protein [Phreatobacter stygius]QCI67128.1 insulinase family protein [Phreatobacter stygius]